jgi:long-subunit acyl-CoA synthetase (AMP-forming)
MRDGFLSITGSQEGLDQDLGRKFIAPQPIENSLAQCSGREAVVLGEKHKFPAVLISLNFPTAGRVGPAARQ